MQFQVPMCSIHSFNHTGSQQLNSYFLVLVLFFLQSTQVQAGFWVKGVVLNDGNDKPLSKASVYINNSTLGTVTNDSGKFEIWIPESGFYELIASYVGFESLSYPLKGGETNLNITFRVKRKVEAMRSVVVLDKETRKRWMAIFMENFIGISLPASTCKLLNPEEVFFESIPKKGVLHAFSYVPLEIINKTYGYRIFFQLEAFHFDRQLQQTYFYGYTRFEELKDSGEVAKKYIRNRERYYEGSTLNFYHSLLEGNLKSNHFSVYLRGSEKSPFFAVSDSGLIKTDSSLGELGKYLGWKDKLVVKYEKVPNGYAYLQRKVFLPLSNNGVQSSITKLVDTVYIDPNGGLKNPLDVQMGGYWEYEKLGNMLPMNYRPVLRKKSDSN